MEREREIVIREIPGLRQAGDHSLSDIVHADQPVEKSAGNVGARCLGGDHRIERLRIAERGYEHTAAVYSGTDIRGVGIHRRRSFEMEAGMVLVTFQRPEQRQDEDEDDNPENDVYSRQT